MVFPNTFEYFVIAIEVVRTRWDAARLSRAAFLWTAGLIWVVVKLPQEWWIHVAQLDFTDEFAELVDEHPWVWGVLAVLAVVLVVVGRRVVQAPAARGLAVHGGRGRRRRARGLGAAGSRRCRADGRRSPRREGRAGGAGHGHPVRVLPADARGGCPWWCSSSRARCSSTRRWRCGAGGRRPRSASRSRSTPSSASSRCWCSRRSPPGSGGRSSVGRRAAVRLRRRARRHPVRPLLGPPRGVRLTRATIPITASVHVRITQRGQRDRRPRTRAT